jgi:8-oxo-dGTP pyrophosphatase MutT (NUDIX family)
VANDPEPAMRRSEAALALIHREEGGPTHWLAQWNERWQAYSLLGGHRRPDETFRQCLLRELGEELGLRDESGYTVADRPLAHLEYTAWSASADAETDYTIQLFEVALAAPARAIVDADPRNRWLSAAEITCGRAADGRPVSPTVERLLAAVSGRTEESVMVPKVHLLPHVRRKLDDVLHELVRGDLAQVFPKAAEVTVYDLIESFSHDQKRKVILAVETRTVARPESNLASASPEFQTHIVKLGLREEVAADVEGWNQVTQGRPVSGRMFVPVALQEVRGEDQRAAAIYRDASQWYGLLTPRQEVATLEWAARAAVFEDSVQLSSVERALRQVFREMGRWFYHDAKVGADAALQFYYRKLRLGDQNRTAIDHWKEGNLWELRRDAVWLLCGYHAPDSPQLPDYLDPYDFTRWVLETGSIPRTLIGCAHGDLHARNVLVGTADDEVEYPLLIDYGDMASGNVLAWDFAKMETELKVRMLAQLFTDESARQELWDRAEQPHFPTLMKRWKEVAGREDLELRTELLGFAFELERLLADRTAQFFRAPPASVIRPAPKPSRLGKAVALLLRIRYEAALQLGEHRHRLEEWQDEYNFALTVYGLNTAKFPDDAYHLYHRLFALVSAGVAAARMSSTREQLEALMQADPPPPGPNASYVVPLYHAYVRWKKKEEPEVAIDILAREVETFDYAVPMRRELALVRATRKRWDEALADLERITLSARATGPNPTQKQLLARFRAFVEIEAPSRMGRIYKDKADSHWEQLGVSYEKLLKLAAAQFYGTAFRYYHEAFRLSGNYYPGGNAAVTALLAGETADARRIAGEVQAICMRIDLASLMAIDRYWVLATEGDMALIQGDADQAADFFRSAIEELPVGNDGTVKCSYDQLCRLCGALGERIVGPAAAVFATTARFRLEPGPVGDCGGRVRSAQSP